MRKWKRRENGKTRKQKLLLAEYGSYSYSYNNLMYKFPAYLEVAWFCQYDI